MADQYYRFFPGDYQRDTGDLSMIEDCAYRRLLDYYYSNEKPLPTDRSRLCRICRAFTTEEEGAVEYIIERYFVLNGDGYRNRKADEEIAERQEFREAQSNRGKKGAEARWGKAQEEAGEMAQAMQTPLPKHEHKDSLPSPSPSPSPSPLPTKDKKSRGKKEKRFSPPSLQEVKNYCIERGNDVNPQVFIDHYQSKGWMIGKNKMKDWKAAVRTWEQRDNGTGRSNSARSDQSGITRETAENAAKLNEQWHNRSGAASPAGNTG